MHVIMNIYYDPGLILSSATFNFNISLSGKTFEKKKKKGLNPLVDSAQIVIFVFVTKSRIIWAKVHFFFVCATQNCAVILCKLLIIIMCYLMSQKVMKSSKDHSLGEHYTLGFEELKIPV